AEAGEGWKCGRRNAATNIAGLMELPGFRFADGPPGVVAGLFLVRPGNRARWRFQYNELTPVFPSFPDFREPCRTGRGQTRPVSPSRLTSRRGAWQHRRTDPASRPSGP